MAMVSVSSISIPSGSCSRTASPARSAGIQAGSAHSAKSRSTAAVTAFRRLARIARISAGLPAGRAGRGVAGHSSPRQRCQVSDRPRPQATPAITDPTGRSSTWTSWSS
jgi:hypothetical protein